MAFNFQPTLTGKLVRLRPLRAEDLEALFAVAADPLIWEQHPAADRYQPAVFRTFFDDALKSGGALLVLDAASGEVIGSSRYHAGDRDGRQVEIGWTFLARRYWGGRYNAEMKSLMLKHAFQYVDRVIFMVGLQNRRSQRALEKIGAKRAGESTDTSGRPGFVYEITADSFEPGPPGMQLEYRELNKSDLVKIGELDRSERVTVGYRVVEGELQAAPVEWDVPKWRPGDAGSHTVAAQIRFCERHMSAGARALGAMHEGRLVGIGVMTPSIRPGLAQLAYLHVSHGYRRTGIAGHLFEELLRFARESGARQVYVSATPSESAVGFYKSLGFRPVTPLPELHELEPEDIHMTMDVPAPPAG